MRKFKKTVAVLSAAVMTLAMGVTAFAEEVTFHFYNAGNWSDVGAWVKQGTGWEEDCLPLDKCILKDTDDGSDPHEPIWPGAKMEAEGGNWYKVTCNYSDFSLGSMMIFNNYVGDSKPGDTTSQADIDKIKAAGVTLNDVAEKLQTNNIMIKKNTAAASDFYIKWDGDSKAPMIVFGKSDLFTTEAPAEYTNRNSGSNSSASTGSGSTGTASTGTAKTTGTGTASSTNAPKTGDTVAVSTIALAIAAAAVVVASKKKVNA